MRYIFYTSDGYTEDMNNKEIENCQILGFANGNDVKDAYRNMLSKNKFLSNYTYSNIFGIEVKGIPVSL